MIQIKTVKSINVNSYDDLMYVPIKLDTSKSYFYLDHDNKWKMTKENCDSFSVPLLPMANAPQFDDHEGKPDDVVLFVYSPHPQLNLLGVVVSYDVKQTKDKIVVKEIWWSGNDLHVIDENDEHYAYLDKQHIRREL